MGACVQITRMDHTAAGLRGIAAKSFDGAQVRRLLALALILSATGARRLRRLRGWTVRRCATGCTATTPTGYLGFARSDPADARPL